MPKETDNDRDERNNHLGWSRVDTTYFDQQFQSKIIDQEIQYHNQHISKKLLATSERRVGESDILIKPKTR